MAKKDETKKATKETRTNKRSTASPKTESLLESLVTKKKKPEIFSKVAQFSFFLIAALYICGFIVAAIHYGNMGLPPPLNLNKYLSAGFFPLLILLLVFLALRYTRSQLEPKKFLNNLMEILWAIALFNGSYHLLVYGFTKTLSGLWKEILAAPFLKIVTIILLVSLFVFPLTIQILLDLKKKSKFIIVIAKMLLVGFSTCAFISSFIFSYFLASKEFWSSIYWLALTLVIALRFKPGESYSFSLKKAADSPLVIIIILFVWLASYTLFIYPDLSPVFGGGQSSRVILWTQKHPLFPHNKLSPGFLEAELIDKTGNEYILSIKDSLGKQYTVEVGKDKVESIIYLTPKEIKARQAKEDSLEEIKKLEGEMMGPFPPDTLSSAPDSA